jgi:hypothetical protein
LPLLVAGKEVRLPYLDEDVRAYAAWLPLPLVLDPLGERGTGDKRVLRAVARVLGLCGSSGLAKRAIQFGSRVAQKSNIRWFGAHHQGSGTALYAGGGTTGASFAGGGHAVGCDEDDECGDD